MPEEAGELLAAIELLQMPATLLFEPPIKESSVEEGAELEKTEAYAEADCAGLKASRQGEMERWTLLTDWAATPPKKSPIPFARMQTFGETSRDFPDSKTRQLDADGDFC